MDIVIRNTNKLNSLFKKCDNTFNININKIKKSSQLLKQCKYLPQDIDIEFWDQRDIIDKININIIDNLENPYIKNNIFYCSTTQFTPLIIQQIRLGYIDPCTLTFNIKNNKIVYDMNNGYGCVAYTIHDIPTLIELDKEKLNCDFVKLYITQLYNLIELYINGHLGDPFMIRSHNQGDRINLEILYEKNNNCTNQNLNFIANLLNGNHSKQENNGMLPFICFFSQSDINNSSLSDKDLKKLINISSYKWWTWIKS